MFIKTIAIAAAAVSVAPAVLAQSAGAPAAVEAPDEVRYREPPWLPTASVFIPSVPVADLLPFRFDSIHFVSFRFVSFRMSNVLELSCADTEPAVFERVPIPPAKCWAISASTCYSHASRS